MKNAMNLIANKAYATGFNALFLLFFIALTGCTLPTQAVRPTVYDFGPGRLTPPLIPIPATAKVGAQAPLLEVEVTAPPALDSTAVLYRLAYADARQLKAYALARWSMVPAQLVRQRLREQLSEHRSAFTLRIELEEFSQLFEAPAHSIGLLRLRATATRNHANGDPWVAQRSVVVQRPAPSADAPGGVHALTAATDAAAQELDGWLQELER